MASSVNRVRLAVSAVTASGAVFGAAAPTWAAPVAATAPASNDAVAAFTLSAGAAVIPNGGTAEIVIDASASTPSAGATTKILTYSYDCGNGQVMDINSALAYCHYSQPGSYPISVSVTDDQGLKATAPTQSVTITYAAPAAPDLSHLSYGPEPGMARGASVGLTPRVFDFRVDLAKATFAINWGDGVTQNFVAATVNPSIGAVHRYDTAGTYTISVTANDGLGLPTSVVTVSKPVTVTPNFIAQPPVSRAAGTDRYDTGALLSRTFWLPTSTPYSFADNRIRATSVVLATGTAFPDALAGVPLANYMHGPLLLTDPHALTPEVETEIKRILPVGATVQVLGGVNALSPAVTDRLTKLGYKVNRIAGTDRYDTAVKIAHAMGDPAMAVVARGDDFPDALTAGPLATSSRNSPPGGPSKPSAVILSDNGTLTPETAAYLKSRLATAPSPQQSPTHLIAIGGGAAKAVRTLPGIDENPTTGNTQILAGTDRYDTARQVAEQFRATSSTTGFYYFSIGVATGTGYADALTGGTYLSEIGGGPLLLTDPTEESPATAAELSRFIDYTPRAIVFGGTKAVSAPIFNAIVTQVHGYAAAF